ncbi:transposable element Tcb1 transposase [Trichonephila clavipes]|uniref:Transposable element Tcb1 transposase n=1 Tax=Trichonephila clavipes TaxID=2585209 RepID=A0A8X6V0Z8_TRICX|nr:transposable element Tcb1 transposase [Trichonephila clavipes]
MGVEFLFMDDNAHPHRANIVDECLESEDITRMDWPAYSPDLNPIEHVWDKLGRRIATRQPLPTCLQELWRALLDEWCNIPQDQIDNLLFSMPTLYQGCEARSLTWDKQTRFIFSYFSGVLEVVSLLCKPKAVSSNTDATDRFSGCEKCRHACEMIM